MIKIEDIYYDQPSPNNAEKKNFKQILQFPDGTTVTSYLPPLVAPNSTIQFWISQLKLQNDVIVNSYLDQGYSSIEQINAGVDGWYDFYIKPRFVI